jgi:hypothetical protein
MKQAGYKMQFLHLLSTFIFYCCWVEVYCGIYKSSYNISNISYLNSSPPSFSFILLHSWNSFNKYCISIYIHGIQYLHHIHPPLEKQAIICFLIHLVFLIHTLSAFEETFLFYITCKWKKCYYKQQLIQSTVVQWE